MSQNYVIWKSVYALCMTFRLMSRGKHCRYVINVKALLPKTVIVNWHFWTLPAKSWACILITVDPILYFIGDCMTGILESAGGIPELSTIKKIIPIDNFILHRIAVSFFLFYCGFIILVGRYLSHSVRIYSMWQNTSQDLFVQ